MTAVVAGALAVLAVVSDGFGAYAGVVGILPSGCTPISIPGAATTPLRPLTAQVGQEDVAYRVSGVGDASEGPILEASGRLSDISLRENQQIKLVAWPDPSTTGRDGKPGANQYFVVPEFRQSDGCWSVDRSQMGYPGVEGVTFQYSFVIVDDRDLTTLTRAEGTQPDEFQKLHVQRIAEFRVPVPK